MGSLAPGTRQPDPDAAIGDLGVLLPADEIDLGGADVSVAGELADLVHRRLVADGVVWRSCSTPSVSRWPTQSPVTAETRQPVRKKTLLIARSRMPWSASEGIASRRAIACFWVKDGVAFVWTPEALTAAMSGAVSHGTSPLAASCW
jgi:hypothetical protein